MILHTPTKRQFANRLEAKRALGGTKGYNRALKDGELIFITVRKHTDIMGI